MNAQTRFPLLPLRQDMYHFVALMALVATLGGCASLTRSTYTAPQANMPAAWGHTTPVAAAAQDVWWKAYGDAQLNTLIDEALAHNADLAAAAIKLRIARLNLGLEKDAMMPSLSASASTSASRSLKGTTGTISREHTVQAGVSYELDLWGKLASARDSAQWELQATEQDKASTALSLIGSTAKLYWQIAYLNERIRLSEESIAYTEKTLALARVKHAAGSVSQLDVLEAEQSLASQKATHTTYLEQREEARTSFALLFDGPPSKEFSEPPTLPTGDLPLIEPGLPASLLSRRPDLQAAELRLREDLATVDNTRLSYYPDLTLTGTVGSSSDRLRNVLNNPVGSLAAELTLPFLQYTEMKLKTGVSQADYDLAVVQFRQSLYTALGDVENALSAHQQYLAQGEQLAISLEKAQASEKINETRYRAGSIPLQTWLDSQETLRTAQAAMLENRYNQLTAQITLNLALGGGTQTLAANTETKTVD